MTFPIYSEKPERIGTFYSWWLPDNPIDGYQWANVETIRGINLSSSHIPDKDGVYRTGGAWLMSKTNSSKEADKFTTFRVGNEKAYSGCYFTTDYYPNYVRENTPYETEDEQWEATNELGAKAYAALKPDQPDFTAVSSLLELKDFINPFREKVREHMRKQKKLERRFGKLTADMYLSYQFAWAPLLNDIAKFYKAFNGRKKRFDQLLRDEGKYVHRKRNLQGESSSNVEFYYKLRQGGANPGMRPQHVSQCYVPSSKGGTNSTRSTKSHDVKVWCAGASKYWLPPGPRDEIWTKKMMGRIMGKKVTPNQLYQIIPWSWFIDYFSGLGDFMDAVSGGIADRVVFKYAYVMRTSVHSSSVTLTQTTYSSKEGGHGHPSCTSTYTRTTKTRVGASPFGWGINNNLTPRKVSILGALGFSRLP